MTKNKFNTYYLSCVFCLVSLVYIAQTKSTNIQTIDGKKFYIHKIQKSQSLYAISKIYTVSIDNLYLSNPELKLGAKSGQEIKIPVNSSGNNASTIIASTSNATLVDTNKFITYKVSKGETFYSIQRKFNLSERQLNAYNPSIEQGLKDGQTIIVGEKIKRKPVKEQKEKKQLASIIKEVKQTPTIIDSSIFVVIPKSKKAVYNIALILPFKLDITLAMDLPALAKTSANFPAIPSLAIDFYLGFKRALDSLAAKDYSINISLYDIDDQDSLKLVQLINSPTFKTFDFIFGPLYANGFKPIAKKAKELSIPIISPITQQNKILFNNHYISKTNPSQFTLLECLADYCIDSLITENTNVFLVSAEKDKKEIAFVSAFKKYYNEKIKLLGKPIKDSIKTVKGIAGLKSAFSSHAKNIVVTLSSNHAFAADFTTQLALFADKKNTVLCGWQSLTEIDNIDQEYLDQLNYTFPHQYNIVNTDSYKPIINNYREQLAAYPGEYYFIGFDIAFYYLKHLKTIGPDFVQTLNNLPYETNYMRFKFARPDVTTGFDNRGVYIFKYNNYQLQKTGWK